MGLRWVCDGVAMGGERREGLCDVAWMHPLLRYRGSAGAAVALHSRKHKKRAQGTFKVGVECVSGSGGTRGSFRGWRSQDVLIVLIT